VSVLKGANATALFGERAKGGAIVITTKKRGPKQGIGVEFTQSVMADNVYILPEYQNLYSGGGSSSLTQYHYAAGQPAEWKALDGKYSRIILMMLAGVLVWQGRNIFLVCMVSRH
jgi:TonB-dependent SusC/RagA subfamily outer membrane receptor